MGEGDDGPELLAGLIVITGAAVPRLAFRPPAGTANAWVSCTRLRAHTPCRVRARCVFDHFWVGATGWRSRRKVPRRPSRLAASHLTFTAQMIPAGSPCRRRANWASGPASNSRHGDGRPLVYMAQATCSPTWPVNCRTARRAWSVTAQAAQAIVIQGMASHRARRFPPDKVHAPKIHAKTRAACAAAGARPSRRSWRGAAQASFHLIEQPMLGICSRGPSPVRATCSMASGRSRRVAFGCGLLTQASEQPRCMQFQRAISGSRRSPDCKRGIVGADHGHNKS